GKELCDAGHKVLVQASAGEMSSMSDDDYKQAGSQIVRSAAEVWRQADMVVKVKEPVFFSSRRRHTRLQGDWSSDVCSSDLSWEKQVFQFSSVATFSMTCSRSFIIKTPPNSVFVSNSGRFFSDVVTTAVSGGRNQTNVPRSEERRVGKECRSRW